MATARRIAAPREGSASLILLHGLGEQANRFDALVDEIHARPALAHVNIVLVQAPTRPVAAFEGRPMPRWFDVTEVGVLTLDAHTSDTAGLAETLAFVAQLIDAEVARGIARERVAIGGFSMGGASTLALATTYAHRVGAFVCMSGFLPLWEHLLAQASAANRDTPVLITQGTADNKATAAAMEIALPVLRERFGLGRVEYVTFERMRHRIDPQCLTVVASFMERVLP